MIDPPVYDVTAFCETHRISRGKFYELLSDGRGPRVMKIGRRTLISGEEAVRWRERMVAETAPTSAFTDARRGKEHTGES